MVGGTDRRMTLTTLQGHEKGGITAEREPQRITKRESPHIGKRKRCVRKQIIAGGDTSIRGGEELP